MTAIDVTGHRRAAGARAPPPADALHPQRRLRARREPAAGARARRGGVRLRHRRQALPGRAELAVLLPARLLVRRGDGGGRRRAALDARVQHQLGHRAPAGDPARRGAGRARARRPQPRVLHQRRLGVGRGGLEDRPPALPGQGRAAAHEGDRARDRLPRRHARRAVVHRRAPDEGAVRRVADPGRARLQHERASATSSRTTRPPTAPSCWTRWSARSSRPGPRPWR